MSANISEKIASESSASLLRRIQAYAFGSRAVIAEENPIENSESQEIILELQNNVQKLADASSRLEFMMGEVSSLIRRR